MVLPFVREQIAAELSATVSPKVNDTKTLHQNMVRVFCGGFEKYFLKKLFYQKEILLLQFKYNIRV